MNELTCIPAYGRDYKSKAALLADWDANKDFFAVGISGQGYVSKETLPKNVTAIEFRYRKKTMAFIHKVG